MKNQELELYMGTKKYTIKSAPVGILLTDDNTLICKSEYRKDNGECECYIISSGEFYCGPQHTICISLIIT